MVRRIHRKEPHTVIHSFPPDTIVGIPSYFTDPFRYRPHPLVRKAAAMVMDMISQMVGDGRISAEESKALDEGKMLGVLAVEGKDGSIGFLAGFSGSVAGHGILPGFVPPIYDLNDPDGDFKKGERELNIINREIAMMQASPHLTSLKAALSETERRIGQETEMMKAAMAVSKKERDEIRCETDDPNRLAVLIRESQHQKAELHRIKERGRKETAALKAEIQDCENKIAELKKLRSAESDRLQKWIFGQYIVSDAEGRMKSIWDIFSEKGLTPPGGTGECAAPKLLNHAFRNGFRPLAMGEFWYGESPTTAVRTHGHFYPSCTSKCGPLLEYMLSAGPRCNGCDESGEPEVIFEDEAVIVASKPSGMPSVPGLDGKGSMQEWLESLRPVESVHRLDMDTSGIMLFAKTKESAVNLRSQFEKHTIRKEYMARLSSADRTRFTCGSRALKAGDHGIIELPLSPDHDERPRQKADKEQGKESLTGYDVISVNEDGTADVIFRPRTGRTHQLRVHSAHLYGLGRPILGDLLYGGCGSVQGESVSCSRLHLHASSITFIHPVTGEELTFTTRINCY